MNITICNINIRSVSVDSQSGTVTISAPHEEEINSDKLGQFIQAIHNVYNSKGSKGYAYFVEHDTDEPMAVGKPIDHCLTDYLNKDDDFAHLSQQCADNLAAKLQHYGIEETGYLLITHYELLGGRYFFIAMLPTAEHYFIDGQFNILANDYIDTAKMQLATRIDLVDYQDNRQANRYISFVRGRVGRKVADFFLEFLGCQEGTNAKANSQHLVQAVETYINSQQFDPEEKQATRKNLVSFCKEQSAAGLDLDLKMLSDNLPSESSEQDFYQFCQQQAEPLESSFPIEQSVINKATKYSGYGNGISISFERGHFGQDVVYNPHNDTLTIRKIPPNLKQQLVDLLNESSNEDN